MIALFVYVKQLIENHASNELLLKMALKHDFHVFSEVKGFVGMGLSNFNFKL